MRASLDEWWAVDTKAPSTGKRDEARRLLKQDMREALAGVRRPYDVFANALKLDDRGLAFEWLEKSYQHHDCWLLFTNVDPEMDAVRSDPRFQAVVKRLGVG